MNEREVDGALNAPGQEAVRRIVRSLPEDTPSMAWRSELNSRLHAVALRRRKLDLFGWIWKPTMGVAVAGALALAFVSRMANVPTPASSRPDVEKALVGSYVDSSAAYEVAGDNVSNGELRDAATQPIRFDLGQEDVGATL